MAMWKSLSTAGKAQKWAALLESKKHKLHGDTAPVKLDRLMPKLMRLAQEGNRSTAPGLEIPSLGMSNKGKRKNVGRKGSPYNTLHAFPVGHSKFTDCQPGLLFASICTLKDAELPFTVMQRENPALDPAATPVKQQARKRAKALQDLQARIRKKWCWSCEALPFKADKCLSFPLQ
eukprot:36820-Pelagomonas_calceolata.AAC.3